MKKLFLILLMALPFLAIAQPDADSTKATDSSKVTEYVTGSTVERLVDKYSDKIEATIVSLAESLKQPAEAVWKILVKQQYVKSVVGLFIVSLMLFFIYLSFKYASNIDDWEDLTVVKGKPAFSGTLFIISIIVSFIMILVTFIGGYPHDIVQGFINPEYGAIQDIISLFK